ncbi:MAG: type VI secretion system contractile sheath large subunit [Gammaproteobacteria bacterium]|nr:type VI secretion system contractile sheath large subunit [Gammaproteobacteria bacterium]
MSKPGIQISGFDMTFEDDRKIGPKDPESPFTILILGNFSGARTAPGKTCIDIDRDNFESVLHKLSPELALPLGGDRNTLLEMHFQNLEDFEPDAIYEKLPLFSRLRDIRDRLQHADTFTQAAAELGFRDETDTTPQFSPPDDSGDLLEAVVSQTQVSTGVGLQNDLEAYIKNIVAPYSMPKAHPKTEELLALVDEAIAGQMRAILHHPDFQELESHWRSLYMVIRQLDTGARLRVQILNITKKDLLQDLITNEDIELSPVYKRVVSDASIPGNHPKSLLIGLYAFANNTVDITLLSLMGLLAQTAQAPFIAAANNRLIHEGDLLATTDDDDWQSTWTEEQQQQWQQLRLSSFAENIALVLPRFLLRLPYGKNTLPIEQFEFDEITDDISDRQFLWGNPAMLAAIVYGQGFSRDGWNMRLPPTQLLDGFPVFAYQEDDEYLALSCAETLLNEQGVQKIRELGLSDLRWVKNTDQLLISLRSIRDNRLQ